MTSERPRPTHRTRSSLAGRLSMGHVIMIVAGLLAVLVNFALLRSRDEIFLVAVADQALTRGAAVTVEDFRVVEVQVGADVLSSLITDGELADIEGWIVARPVSEGELVSHADFVQAAAPQEQRAMSIPVDRVHAVGGAISDADLVDIVAVKDGVAEYIVVAAPVLDVAPSSGSGIGSTGQFYVTVAVDSLSVLKIAGALDEGSVEIIRSTGAHEPKQLVFPELPEEGLDAPGESDAGN